ncbi:MULTISPECIES: ATP-dependent DNA helicase RecQ [Sorangium]|uniref:ATP-dependent DNA helicase RecQ n=1 Tax=Sorangium cellulosum TaxID=56 RepID=A0A4P2QP11_SORCE|nr:MULTISPECIES: ATP-dependent DNA helicase RecQ [Sorangium]AUX31591.1 ATP-dependent DNA helicase RecQ [Sorangium cellulosum]WCQ90968.1 ATP-dependent DNA helicase RecQ [Sorangium sp. Soce836]
MIFAEPPSPIVTERLASSLLRPPESPPPSPPPSIDAVLADRFGIASFRPWQREAIDALLGGAGRVLVVAPTGGGKSLCYQLPAVALPGTTLVLSPLISLMEDQVRALEARGIPATFVASSLPREENGRRLAALRRGEYKLVYAAPERLAFDGFLEALAESRLSLVAVDEAHCIVQWGHDFRPDYLRIGAALARLRPPRVLACTATATPDARDEIIRRLGWPRSSPGDDGAAGEPGPEGPPPKVILRGFARPNLHLQVSAVDGPREAGRLTARALLDALGDPGRPRGAGIVYAATRKGAERLAEALRDAGWNAEAYHAGLAPESRARLSAGFADRSLSVVVATNAFGMGIDRPDVRLVVHAQPPSSIEAYYQEVGRAGRDGDPARGLLLFAPADIALRRRLCQLGEGGAEASADDAARAWGLFRELLRYIDAATCRHDFILRYFGDEAESLGGCGHCDVCLEVDALEESDPAALARDNDLVRRALAGVARAKGGAGMQAIASMLTGESNERVRRMGLDRLSTFGVLEGKRHDEAMSILRVLLANAWIDLTTGEFPVPLVTPSGWRVMRGEVLARVRLPLPAARRKPLRRPAAPSPAARPAATAPSSPTRAPTAARASSSAAHDRAAAAAVAASPAQAEPAVELEERDVPLFEALRAHRAALAKEKSLPAYIIAHDRTLREIARIRPASLDDLALARGMGQAKISSYGEGILRVVREFSGA